MVPWFPSQDVIGWITAVFNVIPVQSMYQAQPSDTRAIVLQDLLGNEMKLTLWGARAREFKAEQVYAAGETGAVIAIFVGVLPKMLQGVKSLSGSSACRWYIDEDLPDINSFHASLGEEVAPVVVYTSMNQGLDAARVREAPVELTVQPLLGLDPFENRTNPPFLLSLSGGWAMTSAGGFSRVEAALKLLMLMDVNSVAQTVLVILLQQNRCRISARICCPVMP